MIVAVSKPVAFDVATVNSLWSWRCGVDGCGHERAGLRWDSFATSMREHVVECHATATYKMPRTA